jgi:hypothetical protein
MSSKGMTKSAASIRVKSTVRVQKVSPAKAKTVGILLSKKEALELARNLLVLGCSDAIQGDIVITGHPEQGLLTVLGYKTWRRDAASRDVASEQLLHPCEPG